MNKFQNRKDILIFITIILLTSFFGHPSMKAEAQGSKIIIDTSSENERAFASMLDQFSKYNGFPKYLKSSIIATKKSMNVETLLEVCNRIASSMLVEWLLEYYYSEGYSITCVVGDWLILELIQ